MKRDAVCQVTKQRGFLIGCLFLYDSYLSHKKKQANAYVFCPLIPWQLNALLVTPALNTLKKQSLHFIKFCNFWTFYVKTMKR